MTEMVKNRSYTISSVRRFKFSVVVAGKVCRTRRSYEGRVVKDEDGLVFCQ